MLAKLRNNVHGKMTKIRKIFKWADRGKHWTSKQTRSANSMSVLGFRTTHTMFFCFLFFVFVFCQANSKAPKEEQVFPYATLVCSFVCGLIHYEADVTVWKSSIVGVDAWYWVQFTKCLGGRSSPNQASGRISPMPPYVFVSRNDDKIILTSLRYQ